MSGTGEAAHGAAEPLPEEGRAAGSFVVGAIVAGSVAVALLLGAALERPRIALVLVGGTAAAASAVALGRRFGAQALWIAALALSILAGELSAVSFGGQNGRLLWADAVLALGFGVALLRCDFTFRLERSDVVVWLVPWIGWATVTLLFARDVLTGIAELKEWLAALAVAAAVSCFTTDARRARAVLALVAWTATLVAALMWVTAMTSPFGWVLAILLKKVDLPWGRTNYLAGILILAIPVTVGLLGHARARTRLGWAVMLAVQATGLAFSASKGAILSLVVGLLVAFGLGGRAARLGIVLTLAVVALGIGLFALGPLHQVLQYRLQESALEYSVGERMDLYRLSWESFTRSPVVGLGLNNFSVAANRLTGVDTVPHNLELGLLAEAGLPGLVLAFAWILMFGRAAWRARSPALAPRDRVVGLGVWAAFVAFVVHNQMESTIYGEQYKILLMMAAVATWTLSRTPPSPDRGT